MISDNLDQGNIVLSLFLDFKKAFNGVDHEILLAKLFNYGVRGFTYDWFSTNLFNRKPYVSINSFNSENILITHGAPQGSILGPLLCLVFISDFSKWNDYFVYILSCYFSNWDEEFIA